MFNDSFNLSSIIPELEFQELINKFEIENQNNFPFPKTNLNSTNQSEFKLESELNDDCVLQKISEEDNNKLDLKKNEKSTFCTNDEIKNSYKKEFIEKKNIESLNINERYFFEKKEIDLLKKNLNFSNKHLGRKRKYEKSEGDSDHDKFAGDNVHRKCKHIILSFALEFINEKLKKIYNGNIGNGVFEKKLLSIGSSQKIDLTANFSKNFLYKTLGEIFSGNISLKYKNYLPEHNSILIKRLLNEKDENKRICIQKLFKITFLQCVEKFIGTNNIEELEGFQTFNEYKKQLNDDQKYIETLKKFFLNFEKDIQKKKGRKNYKKEIKDNND